MKISKILAVFALFLVFASVVKSNFVNAQESVDDSEEVYEPDTSSSQDEVSPMPTEDEESSDEEYTDE